MPLLAHQLVDFTDSPLQIVDDPAALILNLKTTSRQRLIQSLVVLGNAGADLTKLTGFGQQSLFLPPTTVLALIVISPCSVFEGLRSTLRVLEL